MWPRILGSIHQPDTGRRFADVRTRAYEVEVKVRQDQPQWLEEAIARAEAAAVATGRRL